MCGRIYDSGMGTCRLSVWQNLNVLFVVSPTLLCLSTLSNQAAGRGWNALDSETMMTYRIVNPEHTWHTTLIGSMALLASYLMARMEELWCEGKREQKSTGRASDRSRMTVAWHRVRKCTPDILYGT